MMYDIVFSCGHREKRGIEGSKRRISSVIRFLSTEGICKQCFKTKKNHEEQVALAGDEDSIPELIRGKFWNKKFYGKEKKTIYVDNEAIELTDAQLEELHKYLGE